MDIAPPSIDPRIRILEDLRTADRLVASAIATLRYARRQQTFDFLGLPDTEGVFDSQTQRDNASAGSDLIEAEAALRRAEQRLSLPATTAELKLAYWSRWMDLAGGLCDLVPLAKLSSNVDNALLLQRGIRALFQRLHHADAELTASVEPLTAWDDGPSEIATAWQFNRGPIFVMGVLAVLFLVMVLW